MTFKVFSTPLEVFNAFLEADQCTVFYVAYAKKTQDIVFYS